jgi:hypothetical protein
MHWGVIQCHIGNTSAVLAIMRDLAFVDIPRLGLRHIPGREPDPAILGPNRGAPV